jgi:hypothetical protein
MSHADERQRTNALRTRLRGGNLWQNEEVQFPLSTDEHAAIARYLSGIKRQLQEVSDLFTSRYGKGNEISEDAVKTLVAVTLLEHDFLMLEEPQAKAAPRDRDFVSRANYLS